MKVVLLCIDTLRADHLSCYGYNRETSPNIDRLAKVGTLFENAYPSDVPTQPSFTSMFTGRRGIHTGIVSHSQIENLAEDVPCLAEILSQCGVTTAGVSTLYMMRRWFARGFRFYMNPIAGIRDRLQQVDAEEINRMALPWIKEHKSEDFFIFIHYWDPHAIYFPPKEEYRRMFYYGGDPCDPNNHSLERAREIPSSPHCIRHLKKMAELNNLKGEITDREFVISQYDGEIRYADEKVGEVLSTLEELDILDETMVIITSDHGESLGEHDVYFDHCTVHEHTANVPLIVKHPSASRSREVKALVQLIDLAPTILGFFNLPLSEGLEGHDLFPLLSGDEKDGYPEVYCNQGLWTAQRMIRNERWKLIRTIDKTAWDFPERELYDLSKDPHESSNLAEEKEDLADQMDYQMQRWLMKELKNQPDPLRIIAGMGYLAGTRLLETYEMEKGIKTSPKHIVTSTGSYVRWRMRIDRG